MAPTKEPAGDIDVSPLGDMVLTTIQRPGHPEPVKIWMQKKQAARYVLQLQTVLRGMNGQDPFPDHPGYD
jgi:hypothetical protein